MWYCDSLGVIVSGVGAGGAHAQRFLGNEVI